MSPTGWAATAAVLLALFAFDLVRTARRPHAVGFREAVLWSIAYIAVALLFGVVFGLLEGWDLGAQYFAGYIVEKSLSVDNLFVFLIIMSAFAVPAEQQAHALTIGIVVALVLRTIFIAAGAALLDAFSVVFLVFGLALLGTAVQLFRHRNEAPSLDDNVVIAAARRLLPLTDRYDGPRLWTRSGGHRVLTPLFLVLLAIGSTDLLFALDSIPAVFGVTQHAYVVFVANAFALLGLRPLFFLVSGLLDRLIYMSTALASILAFIGVKLVLHFFHLRDPSVPEISTGISLGVIVLALSSATIASLIKVRADPTRRAHPGVVKRTPRMRSRPHRSRALAVARCLDRIRAKSELMTTSAVQPHAPRALIDRERPARVLIVDDHPAVRAGLVGALEDEADLDPIAAVADAGTAAAAARRLLPDVAIVDYRLPGRDGLSLTIELKRLRRPPGVVLYSAFADSPLGVAATVAGADALVKKSSSPEELRWTVRRVASGLRTTPAIPPDVLVDIAAELPPEDVAILGMLMDGLTPGAVAQALGMTDDWTAIRRWAIVRRVIARSPGSR